MPATPDDHLKGSDARLWQLIDERTRPGADKARIDERIWDLFGEQWAIMFTDLSGFSRQVEAFGIIHFLQVIHEKKRWLLPIAADHDGILIKIEADSFLLIFKRARRALECAIAMQQACHRLNAGRPDEEKILLCVGIGHGPILRIGDSDVFGAEVNAASKLGEDTALADQILVTEGARGAIGDLPGVSFTPLEAIIPGSKTNHLVTYPRVAPAR
jgi:class 3 adenylate cyclase